MYRGKVSMMAMDDQILKIQTGNSCYFIERIPNRINVVACNILPQGMARKMMGKEIMRMKFNQTEPAFILLLTFFVQ